MVNKQRLDDLEKSIAGVKTEVAKISELFTEKIGTLQAAVNSLKTWIDLKLTTRLEELHQLIKQEMPGLTKSPSPEKSEAIIDHNHPKIMKKEAAELDSTVLQKNVPEKNDHRSDFKVKFVPEVKMPVFDGKNTVTWLSQAECRFSIWGTSEEEKLRIAYMSVEGVALTWYNWHEKLISPFKDWEDFKNNLMNRFGEMHLGSISERFISLKQVNSVSQYLGKFEELAVLLPDVPDSFMEAVFLNGLKPEISSVIRVLKPKGIDDVIDLALRLDACPLNIFSPAPKQSAEDQDSEPERANCRSDYN